MAFLLVTYKANLFIRKNTPILRVIGMPMHFSGMNIFFWLENNAKFHKMITYGKKAYLDVIVQKRGPMFEFWVSPFHAYARWKGTGEPCSNFFWNLSKNFPRQNWKIICIFISLYDPLSNAMWILDWHPLV